MASVLRATFLHLPGIGPATEVDLWQSGCRDWRDLAERTESLGLTTPSRARLASELRRSEQALAERDVGWFARRLPNREHWRLYPTFAPETAYLDIETTGLSPYGGIVTVVTVHGGGATRSFVAGDDLEELPAYLGRFSVLVTFNGAGSMSRSSSRPSRSSWFRPRISTCASCSTASATPAA